MKFFNRPFLRYALGAGLGAAVLGLGACSNLQQANPSESDFVKMLNSQGQKHYHWSDYLADSHGHEVFKNLEFEMSGLRFKAEELDLQQFKYDEQTKDVNAEHVRLKNIDWVEDGDKMLSIAEIDIPKLAADEQGADTSAKIKKITMYMEDDAEDQTPIVIDKVDYKLTDDYIEDNSLLDLSAMIDGEANLHLKANYTGSKDLKNFAASHKGAGQQVNPYELVELMFQSVKLKSMDIDIQDRGFMSDVVEEIRDGKTPYAEQVAMCQKAESALPSSLRLCSAVTEFIYGNKKTLKIAVRPDEPIPVGHIIYLAQDASIRSLLQLAITLHLKVTN